MKFFGIFLIVLGVACFFAPFVIPPDKSERFVQKDYQSVAQTEAGSLYPLMGISSLATGLALVFASIITNEKGRKA